jgi:hypothetical protein
MHLGRDTGAEKSVLPSESSMKPLAIFSLLLACACLPPRPVAFVDPVGGAEVECVSANAGSLFPLMPSIAEREQREIDRCAAGYERMGWRRE